MQRKNKGTISRETGKKIIEYIETKSSLRFFCELQDIHEKTQKKQTKGSKKTTTQGIRIAVT